MPRIFLPLSKPSKTIRIAGDKARYLTTVLRCKEGDDLTVLDGKGNSFNAIIRSITKKEIIVEVTGVIQQSTESPLRIMLIQGLLKGEKMDLVIQKTTELGIREIIPAITERSQMRETRKIYRWKKIAEEASRQSGRTMIPVIHDPIGFHDAVNLRFTAYDPGRLNGLIFYEEGGMKISEAVEKLKQSVIGSHQLKDYGLIIAIGPEGGFTRREVDTAVSKGFVASYLSKRILRAETAAITATALVQFLMGDLG